MSRRYKRQTDAMDPDKDNKSEIESLIKKGRSGFGEALRDLNVEFK